MTGQPREQGVQSGLVVDFDDNTLLSALFGDHDQNLVRLEQQLGVSLTTRGNRVLIGGEEDLCIRARGILNGLYQRLEQGLPVSRREVDDAIRLGDSSSAAGSVVIQTRKRAIQPRSPNQIHYARFLMDRELVFGIGPAGTGKTYLAVAKAIEAMKQGGVRKLILVRPAVEAGEKLGFLPGDFQAKIDPYLRPMHDALSDLLDPRTRMRWLETEVVEVCPLAYMRGRTLNQAFVILDEAQNTTVQQMLMFLTRLGEGSRMVVTGDPSQVDLPGNVRSGLGDALRRLENVEGIGISRLGAKDVVRHKVVSRIVTAYDEFDRNRDYAPRGERGGRPESQD